MDWKTELRDIGFKVRDDIQYSETTVTEIDFVLKEFYGACISQKEAREAIKGLLKKAEGAG